MCVHVCVLAGIYAFYVCLGMCVCVLWSNMCSHMLVYATYVQVCVQVCVCMSYICRAVFMRTVYVYVCLHGSGCLSCMPELDVGSPWSGVAGYEAARPGQ